LLIFSFSWLYRVALPATCTPRFGGHCQDRQDANVSLPETRCKTSLDLPWILTIQNQKFLVEKLLGEDFFARVWQGKEESTGNAVAIKIFHDQFTSSALWREVCIASTSSHPNLVKFLCYDKDQLCIVMDYAGKENLESYLLRQNLTTEERFQLAADITCGSAFMHASHIVHNDLALKNITVCSSHTYIIDFGVSVELIQSGENERQKLTKTNKNWRKLAKTDKKWQKPAKTSENRQKLVKTLKMH